MRSSPASGPGYNVRAVERAMELLSALAGGDPALGVTELAERLGLHKSTVHRLLVTLEGGGFVEQDQVSGRYRLGLKLFELGAVVGARQELRCEALPYMRDLSAKSGHTVHLVLLSGYDPIYVEKVENPHSVVSYSQIGKKLPLHATAAGKVLLAHLPPADQEEVLRGPLAAYTPNTITDPAVLREHLARIVKQGYALDNEELELGLRCVAAPIRGARGHVVASLSLSGLSATLTPERLPGLTAAARETALAISHRLGYSEALSLLRQG
ncbi:MAG TPA: IclR family transcriptional regulator [Firmicutes bacterium]|uniref:IclR family transcriptional regulator n=1 Tax=Gelria sp. Kuro-4 TaxID=2796927 RepID=UPI0019C67B19|nr:IclR family transcriptional regulator [Gelria sp. Kuro-4]BCV23761.1 IclR family transcriptional regulator [Gelria sp. Kuro-4]HHV56731.1 IclR family transcriptional regulator [Bacillota bacterium]